MFVILLRIFKIVLNTIKDKKEDRSLFINTPTYCASPVLHSFFLLKQHFQLIPSRLKGKKKKKRKKTKRTKN